MQTFVIEKLRFDSSPIDECDVLATRGGAVTLDVRATRFEPPGVVLEPGQRILLRWTGRVFCTCCGKQSPKLFGGFCWNCFNTQAMADACVMAPQNCHYLRGTCRDPGWGRGFCFQPHCVYLSYTGGLKVGITRTHQIPVRWIDQGATRAVMLCLVGSRHQAGVIESALSRHFSDKTAWARMLALGNSKPEQEVWDAALAKIAGLREALGPLDALHVRVSAPPTSPGAGQIKWVPQAAAVDIVYAQALPTKEPKTQAMEKGGTVGGQLLGFKGQYLLFNEGVFNVRRHEGYEVNLEVS